MSTTTISSRPKTPGKRRTAAAPASPLLPGETRTEEQEANETPNARVAATLQRILDGTEPLYGPFKNGEECIAAALAMAD